MPSYTASRHQKQPPASVAISLPAGTVVEEFNAGLLSVIRTFDTRRRVYRIHGVDGEPTTPGYPLRRLRHQPRPPLRPDACQLRGRNGTAALEPRPKQQALDRAQPGMALD